MNPSELKALAVELTAHMVSTGVRRARLEATDWKLELELDPAAQFIASETETRAEPKPKPAGECRAPGCEKPGGHMGQPWCAGHFQAALRGQMS